MLSLLVSTALMLLMWIVLQISTRLLAGEMGRPWGLYPLNSSVASRCSSLTTPLKYAQQRDTSNSSSQVEYISH